MEITINDLIKEEIAGYSIHESLYASASAIDVKPIDLAEAMLYRPLTLSLKKPSKNRAEPSQVVLFIPGHFVQSQDYGPIAQADLMVIGKFPQDEETQEKRLMAGEFGETLFREADSQGLNLRSAYLTNIVRFQPPGGRRSVYKWWVDLCMWFLHHEISIVKPKYILLLGSDAAKAVLDAKSLESIRGTVLEHTFPYGVTAKIVATTLDVTKTPENLPGFRRDLSIMRNALAGFIDIPQEGDYQLIQDEETLTKLVDELIAGAYNEFSLDSEWGKQWPEGELRSVQFSWAAGKAAFVYLRDEQLQPVFQPSIEAAVVQLKRLLERANVHIDGQNFRTDLKWWIRLGLDLLPRFDYDTMLADHLLDENQSHGLKDMCLRYTGLGRYDMELEQWCEDNHVVKSVDGYQYVPIKILFPYGCKDADGGFQCAGATRKRLHEEPKLEALMLTEMAEQAYLYELEQTGFAVDEKRVMELTEFYHQHHDQMHQDLVLEVQSLAAAKLKEWSSAGLGLGGIVKAWVATMGPEYTAPDDPFQKTEKALVWAIAADPAKVQARVERLKITIYDVISTVNAAQGHFNPNSTDQVRSLLFAMLGLTPVKATNKQSWQNYERRH